MPVSKQPRTVSRVIKPEPTSDGAGVRLSRIIGGSQVDWVDPFLLLDHFGSENPSDYRSGFPMHPHRGIETVTYMLSGKVTHRDTMGNAGTIGPGDVQWMTAGGGLMHEEMPEPVDGHMEGLQLWVNLPARLKLGPPAYQEFTASQLPVVRRADGTVVRVIAGESDGVRGPVTEVAMQPTLVDVELAPGARFEQPIPRGHAAFVYVFRGSARVGLDEEGVGTELSGRLAILSDGDVLTAVAGEKGARLVLASGAPTNEEIVRYGPFVMNTREEIAQAIEELRRGTFVREGRRRQK